MRRVKQYPGMIVDATCLQELDKAFTTVFSDIPPFGCLTKMLCRNGLGIERGDEEWFYDSFEEFCLDIDLTYKHTQCVFETNFADPNISLRLNSFITYEPRTIIDLRSDTREPLTKLAYLVDKVWRRRP